MSSDVLVNCLVQLKESAKQLEYDIARAKFKDLYELGLLQGQLVGLEKAHEIIRGKIEDFMKS